MRTHLQTFQHWLVGWSSRRRSGDAFLLMTACAVGIGAGAGAIFFRWQIDTVTGIAFGQTEGLFATWGSYYVILIPALGGLIVGPLLHFFAPEARGHGVPEVMSAVALQGGRIRPVVGVVKAFASSICIGTGGSVGREGPIVQIGSTLGSAAGQLLGMSTARVRVLVACGAAGGIAATFNAPIGGVIFALEVILGEFAAGHFATVVVASVTASVIARTFVGDTPAFKVPSYSLNSPWELLLYVVLGVTAAVVGVLFTKLLYRSEDLFDAWRFPNYFKPVVGGLGVGVIGWLAPEIFGVGYETIEAALHNELLPPILLLLVFAKIAATALTLASGGSGGVFAPSLFIGAMLGGSFFQLAAGWFPGIVGSGGAYSLVGMAAVFAAAAHAPISAVLILFEMTSDYQIILPLMLTTVISTVVARGLMRESIYTMKLSRRGINLAGGQDVDVMRSVRVSEVMDNDPQTVPPSMSADDLLRSFQSYQQRTFPVVDGGKLTGIVSTQDLSQHLSESDTESKVADFAMTSLVTALPDDTMWEALIKMGPRDLNMLPVVEAQRPDCLVGTVKRRDILRAYNLAMMRKNQVTSLIDGSGSSGEPGAALSEFSIETGSAAAGRRVSELTLPERSVIVSIHRAGQLVFPRGQTVLRPGDVLTVFVGKEHEQELRKLLEG